MGRRLRPLALPLLIAVATGCPAAPTGLSPSPAPARSPKASASASATPTAKPAATSTTGATPTPAPLLPTAAPASAFFGRVLGTDGKPAAGVLVRGFLVSDQGSGLITDNGAGVVSNNGGTYRLLADAQAETRTAADGTFTLTDPQGRPLNLEAVANDQLKAIRFAVPKDATGVTLQLAPTGAITGQVTAAGVTDFLGVDVFVPGTSYVAKADAQGRFRIDHVPVGAFTLVAMKTGLGKAVAEGVAVASGKTTDAPPLTLVAQLPEIASVSPTAAGPGATLTIKGKHFGQAGGATIGVSVGGAAAAAVKRVDDATLEVAVPDGAKGGDVVVTVDGLASKPGAFTPLKSLAFPHAGFVLPIGRKEALPLRVLGMDEAPVAGAAVTWAVEGTAVKVDAAGKLEAVEAGTATLVATSGTLKARLPVQVGPAPMVGTLAGDGTEGTAEGPASAARFAYPYELGAGPDGSVYVESGTRLLRIAPDGMVRVLAGSAKGWMDGKGAAAQLYDASCLQVDALGVVHFFDNEAFRVRKAAPDGTVTTLAGNGATGFLPDGRIVDGAADKARFQGLYGLVLGEAGVIWVLDGGMLRKVEPGGAVTTVGAETGGNSMAPAPDGGFYVTNSGRHTILKVSQAGVVTPWAGQDGVMGDADGPRATATFASPSGLAADAAGNLYVSDGETRIRKIAVDGTVSTIAGARQQTGYVDGAGGAAGPARFKQTHGLAVGPNGDLYVADNFNHRIRVIKF